LPVAQRLPVPEGALRAGFAVAAVVAVAVAVVGVLAVEVVAAVLVPKGQRRRRRTTLPMSTAN